jgi:hypothetical protein
MTDLSKECDMKLSDLNEVMNAKPFSETVIIKEYLEYVIERLLDMGVKHSIFNINEMDIIIQPAKKAEVHEIPNK